MRDFTKEEKSVLDEYVHNIRAISKNRYGFVRVDDIEKSMMYNFRHGKGAALKLLYKALPTMQSMYALSDDEFQALEKQAEQVARYEVWHWEYVEELPDINPSNIVIHGENYVILKTGIRLDYGFDFYEHLREEFARTGIYDEGLR